MASEFNDENTEPKATSSEAATATQNTPKFKPDRRFWVLFTALILTALVSALDGSIVATALPTITRDLNVGENYIWVVNVYFLSSAACQPLCGQCADLWGRRWPTLIVVALFVLGSGICGGATTSSMLIAGRAVQGLGAGGINTYVDIIICDLVPLRDRATYVGGLFVAISIGSAFGPFIGGALAQHSSWRWVFYLNLPIGCAALLLLFLCLRTKFKGGKVLEQLSQIDHVGNVILVGATVAILYALTYGGTLQPWTSGTVIAPLVIGLVGFIVFGFFESTTKLCKDPVMPPRIFRNRTTTVALVTSFTHAILTFWIIYFYPVYFQAVKGSSPTRSGVQVLPISLTFPVCAAIGGTLVTKLGRYKPMHLVGFALLTLGSGCTTLLDRDSPDAAWVLLEMVLGSGLGLLISTLLPAVQASLPDSDTAVSAATWAYIRSLGMIWGVSIPAAIFNSRFDGLLGHITDTAVQARLSHGQAYEHASSGFIASFAEPTRGQIVAVYTLSLQRVWQVGTALAGASLLCALLEGEVELRTTLATNYGLEEQD